MATLWVRICRGKTWQTRWIRRTKSFCQSGSFLFDCLIRSVDYLYVRLIVISSPQWEMTNCQQVSLQFQIPWLWRKISSSTHGVISMYLLILIHWVINHLIMSSGLALVLVAPLWPYWEWFPILLSLLSAESLRLLVMWNLVQLHINFHRALDVIKFHIAMLSSSSSEKQAFQNRLWERSQHMSRDHELAYTRGKWSNLYLWCPERSIIPSKATVQEIVTGKFFVYLPREKGLLLSAVKEYHSALKPHLFPSWYEPI